MSEVHCHCECSKCPPPASTQAFSCFEESLTALTIGPCGRLSQITRSADLSSAIALGFVLTCGKPQTLHPTRDSPGDLDPANLEATAPLQENLDSWPAVSTVRCALCVLARCLLEDESCGQQAISIVDKIWKQLANVIRAINFSFLFAKIQPSFATETHTSHHHMLCKLFVLNKKTT